MKKILEEKGEKVYGRFPDKKSRNGKEQVSYEAFYMELQNSCCGANLLTYMATVDAIELYRAFFAINKITIPKGNLCGIFSSMQGGGSLMEMELLKSVEVDLGNTKYPHFRMQLEIDGKGYDYSIMQTYGVCRSSYGKPLNIVSQAKLRKAA